MIRYMLDSNMIALIAKEHPLVLAKLSTIKPHQVYISNITLAEVYYGLARRPDAVRLQRIMTTLLKKIQVSVFDEVASQHYGEFKANIHAQGKHLEPLDMLVASHADGLKMILLSNEQAFFKIQGLKVEDWTQNQS